MTPKTVPFHVGDPGPLPIHGKCIEPRRKFIVQSTCREFATVYTCNYKIRSSAVINGQRVSASRYVS